MTCRTPLLAAALALLPAVSGCSDSPVASRGEPVFTASVRGSVEDEFRGVGQFQQLSGGPGQPHPGNFMVTAGSLIDRRSFTLFREGAVLPAPGSYPLTPTAAGSRRFVAVFVRRQGDALEGFTSVEGELRITVSTPWWVEGTFRFQGRRNCQGTVATVREPGATSSIVCSHPIDPALPAVEVTGSFTATPAGTPPPFPF